MKSRVLISLVLLMALVFPVLTSAQSAAPGKHPAAPSRLPSKSEVEAVLRRVYGYDPSIQWNVWLVRRSAVPGMNEVLLQLKGEFHHLFLTADGRYAIDGDMQPFGPDPYAAVRARLSAAEGLARGPAKPVVTMVEFSDLQCPHCKQSQPVVEKLAADFPGMRLVFQHYPLNSHPWAMKAALYADCAGRMNNAAAWKLIAAIYENQNSIALPIADDKLKELATAAGLDASKLSACVAAPSTATRVKKSMELGDSLGIMGTPAIFVNGRLLENMVGVPYAQVKAIVQYEIAHAGK
jgi:protein-disulfide isomerase